MKKRDIILFAVIILVLAVIAFFILKPGKECNCVKVQTTCCPCSMGGQEKCVSESESANYPPKTCPSDLVCAAMYNCNENLCGCKNGKCDFKE